MDRLLNDRQGLVLEAISQGALPEGLHLGQVDLAHFVRLSLALHIQQAARMTGVDVVLLRAHANVEMALQEFSRRHLQHRPTKTFLQHGHLVKIRQN